MEYDSAFKRRETDTSNNRMKLEDMVLSEISQPAINEQILHDSTYVRCLEPPKSDKVEWWVPGAGRREWGAVI